MRLTAAGIAPAFFAPYFRPEISTKNIDSGLIGAVPTTAYSSIE
jgi:hypothetical protein